LFFPGAGTEPLSLSTGSWIHLVLRRRDGDIGIFVNGELKGGGFNPGDLDSISSLKLGHRGGPGDTPGSVDERGFYFNGRMDEVQYFVGRALTDAEIGVIAGAGAAGVCKPGSWQCGSVTCPAPQDACHDTGQCIPSTGTCFTPAKIDGSLCVDGNACNGAETCQQGVCTAGTPPGPPMVMAVNACREAVCNPSAGWWLVPKAVGTSCADGNVCNGDEICGMSGYCAEGVAPPTDDGNPCTADGCSSGGVFHAALPEGAACPIGACTAGECRGGAGQRAASGQRRSGFDGHAAGAGRAGGDDRGRRAARRHAGYGVVGAGERGRGRQYSSIRPARRRRPSSIWRGRTYCGWWATTHSSPRATR